MTDEMFQELERASKQTRVQKQELVRQLIEFGLKEIKTKKDAV
jgi:predicted DNA-binding protein